MQESYVHLIGKKGKFIFFYGKIIIENIKFFFKYQFFKHIKYKFRKEYLIFVGQVRIIVQRTIALAIGLQWFKESIKWI